jgi:hypothetical protein
MNDPTMATEVMKRNLVRRKRNFTNQKNQDFPRPTAKVLAGLHEQNVCHAMRIHKTAK